MLQVEGLSLGFAIAGQPTVTPLVEDLSFSIAPGEVLSLVGESGCGKSLSVQAILGLLPPAAQRLAGSVQLQGQELTTLSPEALRRLRGKAMALIPQDPMSALNPVYTVGFQIDEVLKTHTSLSPPERLARCQALLEQVQLPNAKERLNSYPHQLSGGMRQRVLIAMALACNPQLILADEPTTALDVTVQAQILRLLDELRRDLGMSVLLITHDLGVVAEISDRVAVMYAGHVVETATATELFANPLHPYTQGLLASQPQLQWGMGSEAYVPPRLVPIAGQPPTARALPSGCRFHVRCGVGPQAACWPQCQSQKPPLQAVVSSLGEPSPVHCAACWLL